MPPSEDGFTATSRLMATLERDAWAGSVLRGGIPRVPVRDALPTAEESQAYRMLVLRGTPDVLYICLRNAGGTWDWRTAATG